MLRWKDKKLFWSKLNSESDKQDKMIVRIEFGDT